MLKIHLIAILTVVSAVVSPVHAQEVVKFGAPLAITGGLADEGGKQALAQRMWAKKVNDAGGISVGSKKLPVRIIEYDYQSDGNRAAQVTEKLINDDKVDFLFAPYGSGHTKITATVAERYRVPMLACVAASDPVFDAGNKYLFGTLASLSTLTNSMASLFKEKLPNTKRVAVLGRDDVFPKTMAQSTVASAKAIGMEIVYSELYSVGTMDQSSALSSIKAAKPDWIFLTGYTQDLLLLRKQMKDANLTAPIITMVTGPAYREFIDGVGEAFANNITAVTWWHSSQKYEGVGPWRTSKDFVDDFKKANNNAEPDYVHASCAAAPVVLQTAIEQIGSLDKDAVRNALSKIDIQTFYGPVKFGANGMNQSRDMPVLQVQNNVIKVVYPAAIADGQLRPVTP